MSPAEKAARHAKLYKVVTTHTSHSWAAILVKQLLGQLGRQGMARQTPYIPKDRLEGAYKTAKKRLFLFDYDVSKTVIDFLLVGVLGVESFVSPPPFFLVWLLRRSRSLLPSLF